MKRSSSTTTAKRAGTVVRVKLEPATSADAATVADIRNAAAQKLAADFGAGHWSSLTSEHGVVRQMKHGVVFLARDKKGPFATLTLSRKKPWAHDRSYFTSGRNPHYLTGMAVAPDRQRRGVGRACILEAITHAKETCDAIWLDAYDHAAGAGEFYRKCGFGERGRIVFRGVALIYFEMLL